MVTVHLTRGMAGIPSELTVSGHAGQGDYGQDIVCAAVSALVETLALGLNEVLHEPSRAQVDPGRAHFQFRPTIGVESRAVVETIVAGLKDLAVSEPDAVRYVERSTTFESD